MTRRRRRPEQYPYKLVIEASFECEPSDDEIGEINEMIARTGGVDKATLTLPPRPGEERDVTKL